ncbi:MAG: FMN-binding negative transcriptional regulator, partial [Paracoccaceae bacterium]|nr:FMN-binding negative transcriptional regulator [Paracoccaceae bacterium]
TGRLFGHLALANDLHRDIVPDTEVIVIFRGDEAYVSPNWYPSKAEHHKQVPTWNYQVVHVHGTIRFQHDDKTKRAVVGRMTKYFETLTNADHAWRMADAPNDYIQVMLDNIVAFEIKAEKTIAKSKLSQNKDGRDLENVAVELGAHGKTGLMRRIRKILSARQV